MAEGWAKHFGGEDTEVYSAGIVAHGLNPRAVKAMKEAGVDISSQTSKLIDVDILQRATYVITLCGDANDKCPVTPPHVQRLHWGLLDPAQALGTPSEIEAKFIEVRDDIRDRVQTFLAEISNEMAEE